MKPFERFISVRLTRITFEVLVIGAGFLLLSLLLKTHWVTNFMVFCIFAMSFDLLYGFMGHLSFGHMLYFGAGSYLTALTLIHLSPDPLISSVIALLATFLLSSVIGLIALRTKGASFALLNMAFNEVGYFLAASLLVKYTKGADGLSFSPRPLFGVFNFYHDTHAFIVTLFSLLLVYLILRFITSAPYGIMIRSIKENEKRTEFFGYNTFALKWLTFNISALIAGFSGCLFALTQGFVSPSTVSPFGNVDVIFAVLIGGAGNIVGAIIGGNLLMILKNQLPTMIPHLEKLLGLRLPQWEMWLGIILLVIVFVWRKGVTGYLGHRIRAKALAMGKYHD